MITNTPLLISISLLCCLGILLANMYLNFFDTHKYVYTQVINNSFAKGFFFVYKKGELKRSDRCILPVVDPWDSTVVKHLNPQKNPLKDCKQPEMHTYLTDGQLRVFDNSTSNCSYRCLVNTAEKAYVGEKWIPMRKSVNYRVNCDFIETHCTEGSNTTFRFIHTQVIRSRFKYFQREDELHPSVVILLFDSTSSSSGIRSISETVQILRQYYDATTFYHHNKVGINSRPNAFAMFSGTRISRLDSRQFPGKSAPDYENSCKLGLRRNETVTYDFYDQGYASFDAEDWIGAFTWPNCNGFGENVPVHHYSGAYTLRLSKWGIREEMQKSYGCQTKYFQLMEYFDQFLAEYDGVAKYSMIWLSTLSHETVNGLYHADKFFANFFRRQAGRLRNSFIFLMGDQGIRYGPVRWTNVGLVEDNNPLLMIAVPEHLRSNKQLITNLRLNARRHTSQYDIYATLYDIARVAKRQNFMKWDDYDFRTCFEMEIADSFCICAQNWSVIRNDAPQVEEAANAIITFINDLLSSHNVSNLCSTVELKKILKTEIREDEPVIKLSIKVGPSDGKFEAQLGMVNGEFQLITNVYRTNSYDQQGDCVKDEEVRPLCYCKQQPTLSTVDSVTKVKKKEKKNESNKNKKKKKESKKNRKKKKESKKNRKKKTYDE